MSGMIILSDDLDIIALVKCKYCIHHDDNKCEKWHQEVDKDGWCYKGEEPDTNDLYSDEDSFE